VQQRFQTFCTANQLTYTRDKNTIVWDPALAGRLTARIDPFNDLYSAGKFGATWHAVSGIEPSHEKWPHTPRVVEKFLAWVKTNLEAELVKSSGP
jgi:hypothetical protein